MKDVNVEVDRCGNNARKFYQKVNRFTVISPERLPAKIRNENLIKDLLQGDDDTNNAFRDVVPNPINDDGVEIPPPCHEDSDA